MPSRFEFIRGIYQSERREIGFEGFPFPVSWHMTFFRMSNLANPVYITVFEMHYALESCIYLSYTLNT